MMSTAPSNRGTDIESHAIPGETILLKQSRPATPWANLELILLRLTFSDGNCLYGKVGITA